MTATILRNGELVRQALSCGELTVTDPETGFHRLVYADCPTDGQAARPVRIVRGPDRGVAQVTMRCPRCGNEFVPSTAAIYLR